MIKRIVECYFKYRKWFFFVACVLTIFTLSYLHGSVYRYVLYIDGLRKVAKDARSLGVFHIYIWLSSITLLSLILAGIPYYFSKNEISNAEKITFTFFIFGLVFLIVISLVVLGVFYV